VPLQVAIAQAWVSVSELVLLVVNERTDAHTLYVCTV